MTPDPYFRRLNAYRLERDLSWESLAAEMHEAGCGVKARSLHVALTGRLQVGPRERTMYKIRRFVDVAVKRRTGKPVVKRRSSRAGA